MNKHLIINKKISQFTLMDSLFGAVDSGDADAINVLIANSTNVGVLNIYGRYPLHMACCRGSMDTIKALLAAGGNVNVQTEYGRTPLHTACDWNNMSVVQLLLEAGADPTIKDCDGKLPQDVTKNEKIRELFEQFGGGRATKAAKDHE